ncbi:DUF3005 domain-containing protein [Caballeronia sp. NCTM1]|uniref:DUF3005 domain-containing protein n=1 Tax=Caballeronia sp. NCTM1 TaxID=2921753 RepID=UPI0020286D59|nr:DUF3005 domain-containing protein [Caballeronia sp. NCTM1]
MQNAEGNPTQAQQNEMAAKSPAKTPATGTASPDAATQAAEFGRDRNAGSAEPGQRNDPSPLPDIDHASIARDSGDPVQRANSRIVGVDSQGMGSTDDTVDADAKSIEARRDLSGWHDNVITSNATLENNVPAPAAGLGGIDSRVTGNLPSILPKPSYRVVVTETVYAEERNGSRASHVFRLEPE